MALLDGKDLASLPLEQRLPEASRQLESLLLKQMLSASGAFHASTVAGGSLRTDLFVDALADAVSHSGGMGLAAQIQRQASGPTPTPDPGSAHITSGFGTRTDPFDGHAAFHSGVDIGAPEGTPIAATAAGVVRSAGMRGGYGEAIEIDHGNGTSTLYAHASEVRVKAGETVAAGQVIGLVGHTGRATGSHLHLELRRDGHPVDPASALKAYLQRADE